jgi:hypothetical protein
MKKIIIITLMILTLSTKSFAEDNIVAINAEWLDDDCRLKEFVEYKPKIKRYCSLVVTTCLLNDYQSKALIDTDCTVNQITAKDIYTSQKQ